MIALSPKFCFQHVKHQNNLGIIKIPHWPPRKLLFVLSPFGQTVHLLLVPRLVEGLNRLNIYVHLCWSRSFIFSLLSIVVSLLALAQMPQVIISISFSKKRSGFVMHSTLLLYPVLSAKSGMQILLNITYSPYRNGSFFASSSLPNFEFVWLLLSAQ